MHRGLLLAAISVFLPLHAVWAQSVPMAPLKNMNPKDVSAIFPECEVSADGRQMTCSIVQVWARPKRSTEDANAELEKQLKDVTPGDFAKTCKDQRAEIDDLLKKAAAQTDVSPRLIGFLREWLGRFITACDRPSVETMREFIRYGLDKDTRTCMIYANPWQETFNKSLGGKWVSNRGPSGLCGTVIVSTFDSKPFDPKKPDDPLRRWVYETQKIVTNKDVSPLCFRDESKVVYSWEAKDFGQSCEFIEFGF